jgi:hypothetical protein
LEIYFFMGTVTIWFVLGRKVSEENPVFLFLFDATIFVYYYNIIINQNGIALKVKPPQTEKHGIKKTILGISQLLILVFWILFPQFPNQRNLLFTTISFSRVISCMEYGIPPKPSPEASRPPNGIQSTRKAVWSLTITVVAFNF